MIDPDELMRLHAAATSGKWTISLVPDTEFPGVQIYDLYTGRRFLGQLDTHFPGDPEANYIVAACNAVPELVQRIRELEEQLDVNEMRMKKSGDVFTKMLKAMHKITDTKEDQEVVPFKQFSALEPCRIVSNNNSTQPEWLMRRFTEVK